MSLGLIVDFDPGKLTCRGAGVKRWDGLLLLWPAIAEYAGVDEEGHRERGTARIGGSAMRLWRLLGPLLAAVVGTAAAADVNAQDFRVRSADGVEIHGVARADAPRPRLAVIFVAGTGLFDRDANFGKTGTPRDLVFKDLAERMAARGVASVRYDMRGVRYGTADRFDRALLARRTTSVMRDDLGAVYQWSRAPDGLGAACVAFFAHSEGMLHIARLAELGAPAPALIIGMGAGMESPAAIVRWQLSERDIHSLKLMDTDGDGTTTNGEIRANLARTPSAVHGKLEPYFHPSGRWKADDIAALRAIQLAIYDKVRKEVLTHPDDDVYPDADQAFASYQWWKSWFLDERPAAELLARWRVPIILHYGDKDSQTPAPQQIAAAKAFLPADKVAVHVHADRGHTLGDDVVLGPIDVAIADGIAEEAAGAAAACPRK
jgi:hypothetical protein